MMRTIDLMAAAMCVLLHGIPSAVFALDLTQKLNQLHHTAWTAKDGLNGAPNSLAQTTDGFLWIGTTDGLFRFDGRQFERVRPENAELPAASVSALHATPDGGLWIGYQRGGVSFLDQNLHLTNYTDRDGLPVSRIRSFARDHDGVVWVGAVGGIAYLEGQRWRRVRNGALNLTSRSAWKLVVDPEGTLWVFGASPNRIFFRRKGESHFQDAGVNKSGFGAARTADGTWLFLDADGDDVSALTIGADGRSRLDKVLPLPGLELEIDRDGGLWLAGYDIVRVPVADVLAARSGGRGGAGGPARLPIERFTRSDGLSGRIATDVLEDREGNIWVATDGGLDRFRRRNLTWERRHDNPAAAVGLVAGDNGDVWAVSPGSPSLRRLRDGSVPASAPESLMMSYRDPHGVIWLSTRSELWRWSDGRFAAIEPPKESRARGIPLHILAATMDRAGRLWFSVAGLGQYAYEDGVWTFKKILQDRPDMTAIAAHADDADRVWLAYRDEIARVEGDKVRVFSASDGLANAPLSTLAGRDRQLWVGGELGLAFLRDERFHVVRFAGRARIGAVTGIVVTTEGGLWLHAGIGIVHVPRAEVEKVLRDPSYAVKEELFDTISDLPDPLHTRITGIAPTTAVESTDGVLWFMTSQGVARLDPGRVMRNALPPPVSIRSVIADERPYSLRGDVKLPARTKTIQIDYTALSLSIPERVEFRYRLEGWETDWHDAGTRRSAFYTQLEPGDYRFRVIASNNDGVWNEAGAAVAFTIAPAWFQTRWFHAGATVTALALLWGIYQLRVRQIAAAMAARFEGRLTERTRIARDLHDTLLQTVQASKIIADEALRNAKEPQDKSALEQLSEWLGQAVREGRAALNSLRTSSVNLIDLAQAFRAAAETIPASAQPMTVSVSVNGPQQTLHPAIREDIFRIGYEAMRNAWAHSKGTQLSVAIECGHDLVVRVTDNGIGIGSALSTEGKDGHFGLRGMRERAADIGAALKVISSETGTSVIVTVPGRVAFRHDPSPTHS